MHVKCRTLSAIALKTHDANHCMSDFWKGSCRIDGTSATTTGHGTGSHVDNVALGLCACSKLNQTASCTHCLPKSHLLIAYRRVALDFQRSTSQPVRQFNRRVAACRRKETTTTIFLTRWSITCIIRHITTVPPCPICFSVTSEDS